MLTVQVPPVLNERELAIVSSMNMKNTTFSLRAFARLVGVSPSHLSRALSGQKRLSATSARQISLALNHTSEEADHFLGLIELEGSEVPEQRAKILQRLITDLSDIADVEVVPKMEGYQMFTILSPKKAKVAKSEKPKPTNGGEQSKPNQ